MWKVRKTHRHIHTTDNPRWKAHVGSGKLLILKRWHPDNVRVLILPALSKESSGILLLPLSVRPPVRPKENFVTGTPFTF